MAHSLANLEYHHFKYPGFRRPGDVHVHFFGTATLSFADGIRTQEGDRFRQRCRGVIRELTRDHGHSSPDDCVADDR